MSVAWTSRTRAVNYRRQRAGQSLGKIAICLLGEGDLIVGLGK